MVRGEDLLLVYWRPGQVRKSYTLFAHALAALRATTSLCVHHCWPCQVPKFLRPPKDYASRLKVESYRKAGAPRDLAFLMLGRVEAIVQSVLRRLRLLAMTPRVFNEI